MHLYHGLVTQFQMFYVVSVLVILMALLHGKAYIPLILFFDLISILSHGKLIDSIFPICK